MLITSKENDRIKEIKKLKQKKYRKDKFIVEGIKMVQEAINEKANIELIVVRSGFVVNIDISKYETIEVSDKVFDDLTDVVTPQGILAIIKKQKVGDSVDTSCNYILALDGIQDPGNLGTIIRTADAANIKQVLVSKDTVDCYSPKVIRSTMGAIYRVNVVEVESLATTLLNIKKRGFEVVTTDLKSNTNMYDIDYHNKVVVIGNEANGVSKEVKQVSDIDVIIPMPGKAESLNASIAAGLMIYEYVRQNNDKDY